jgi:methyl halide transferase
MTISLARATLSFMDPAHAEFWSSRYQSGSTGWDLGAPSPNLQALVREHVAPGAHLFVPGCGRGHDAVAFAAAGYRVTALDFAPEAIAAAAELAAKHGVEVAWEQGDLFADRPAWAHQFDAWVELTCYCAIPLGCRPDYAAQAARWIKPGGKLVGVFFVGLPEGGPPFDSTAEELRTRFAPPFVVEHLRPSERSVAGRQGLEWEGILRLP